MHPSALGVVALALLTVGAPAAAEAIRTQRVRFAPGQTSLAIEGRIAGRETVDYMVGARQGQSMKVGMTSSNGANFFNILAPGEATVAFFNGSMDENRYEGILPKTGDYRIRVYLMRSAARRNEGARFRLAVTVADAGRAGSTDAVVAGTNYHATGTIPCAMAAAQPMGSCAFGVTRMGAGSGRVTITRPDGQARTIVFDRGEATGTDENPADAGTFQATRQGDLTSVHVGEERYEIPDAVLFGG